MFILVAVLLAANSSPSNTGVNVRQFRLAVNIAQSYAELEYDGFSEYEIQVDVVGLINEMNRDTLTPYAGCRFVPNVNLIRVWDDRFSYDAFNGRTSTYEDAKAFNQSLTTSTHGLTTWDSSVVLFYNSGLNLGGNSDLGIVCNNSYKGRTACNFNSSSPAQATMTHELCHALGAPHTFDAITGWCEGQRNGASAVEIGAGITIMSYAGNAGAGDNYPNSNSRYPRLHALSTQDILSYLSNLSETLSPVSHSGLTPQA